jgi:hypothetical protein
MLMFVVMMRMVMMRVVVVMMVMMRVIVVIIMVVIVMMMNFVIAALTINLKAASGDAVGFTRHKFVSKTVDRQTFQSRIQFFATAAKLQQSRHSHIAGNPRTTFQIQHPAHFHLLESA